jgi:hypothetical protein
VKEKDVGMNIEAAFPLTPTSSFISYGKIMFDLRAHFQERNYRVNREVAALRLSQQPEKEECNRTETSSIGYCHLPENVASLRVGLHRSATVIFPRM